MFSFFFSSRRRHTRFDCDWSSDVCSSDLSVFLSKMSLIKTLKICEEGIRLGLMQRDRRIGRKTMNSNFIAQKAEPCGPALVSAMIGVFDTGKDAALILPGLRGGQLFAYLFRRFGYPNSGWDDHKELVYYLLTTPMDNVFLAVRPHMGGDYADNRPQSRHHR